MVFISVKEHPLDRWEVSSIQFSLSRGSVGFSCRAYMNENAKIPLVFIASLTVQFIEKKDIISGFISVLGFSDLDVSR